MLSRTLQALDEARLLADVRNGAMNLALLHVVGPTPTSLNEVITSAEKIGGNTRHLLVKNHINETTYDEWTGSAQKLLDGFKDLTISVPQIPAIACETVQKLGGSFTGFTRGDQSRTLRGLVATWLNQVWAEFDRVKIHELVAAYRKSA
jgi:hypothetical protein